MLYHFKLLLYSLIPHSIIYDYCQLSGGGKNRRSSYHDGDQEDLSLVDLQKLHPCREKNCTLASSTTKIEEYIAYVRSNEKEDGKGAPNNDDDVEEEADDDDDEDVSKLDTSGDRKKSPPPDSDEESLFGSSDDENKKDSCDVDSDEKSLFSSDDDSDSEESRFSKISGDQQQQRPPKRIAVEQKRKIIAAPSLVTKYNIPPEIRIEPTCKYFMVL